MNNKILLLTTFDIKNTELILENCKKQYYIFLYFINKYLQKSKYKIIIQNIDENEIKTATHCLIIDNRGIYNRSDEFYNKLRKTISGFITTISANTNYRGKEDVLFYMIPAGKRKRHSCKFIGWACDPLILQPNQNSDKINILIDHQYYGDQNSRMFKIDQTLKISSKLFELAKLSNNIILKRFCKGGIENVTKDNYKTIDKYIQNQGLNYYEACKIYSKTDIFFVTHPECMGLVVLECAMAGALIVTPKDFIKGELLKYVNHVIINPDNFNLINIIKQINHKKSREMVYRFNWENVSKKILNTFDNYQEYLKNDLIFTRSIRI